jgi:hypothetical protein
MSALAIMVHGSWFMNMIAISKQHFSRAKRPISGNLCFRFRVLVFQGDLQSTMEEILTTNVSPVRRSRAPFLGNRIQCGFCHYQNIVLFPVLLLGLLLKELDHAVSTLFPQ